MIFNVVEQSQILEPILLDLEEENQLLFHINVEGTTSPAPAKVRLLCHNGDVSYVFNGTRTIEEGIVSFTVPKMLNVVKEGTYGCEVEVLIENRYFAPISFDVEFVKSMEVVAEAISVSRVQEKPTMKISAAPIDVERRERTVQPLVVETERKPSPVLSPKRKAIVKENKTHNETKKEQPKPLPEPRKTLRELYEDKSTALFTGDDEVVSEIIKKCGDEWCLYTKHKVNGKRRRLGTHPSKEAAEKQEKAIKANGG